MNLLCQVWHALVVQDLGKQSLLMTFACPANSVTIVYFSPVSPFFEVCNSTAAPCLALCYRYGDVFTLFLSRNPKQMWATDCTRNEHLFVCSLASSLKVAFLLMELLHFSPALKVFPFPTYCFHGFTPHWPACYPIDGQCTSQLNWISDILQHYINLHWNRQANVAVLNAAQIWDCCSSTLGQG